VIEDLERVEQLGPEEGAAPSVIGQRGERGDDGKIPNVLAEIRLDAPQRDDEAGLDAVLGADLLEQRAVLARRARAVSMRCCGTTVRYTARR